MDITHRNFQFSLDAYDDIGRVFGMYLKERILGLIAQGQLTTRFNFEYTFELHSEDLRKLLPQFGTVYDVGTGGSVVINDEYMLKVEIVRDEEPVRFKIWTGCRAEQIDIIRTKVLEVFSPYSYDKLALDVTWAVHGNRGLEYVNMQTSLDETVLPEAYPFLPSLDEFVNGYLDHKSPVILLIGPPGTGKTRLIKYILKTIGVRRRENMSTTKIAGSRRGRLFAEPTAETAGGMNAPRNPSILYSMEDKIFKEDGFFVTFLSDTYDAMVLEDIDFNLGRRKDGNTFMYKLLGGSDGIISGLGKKIILSTNLTALTNIDEALLRPGRCYGTFSTRALTLEEAQVVAGILKKDLSLLPKKEKKNEVTLAEIYNIPS